MFLFHSLSRFHSYFQNSGSTFVGFLSTACSVPAEESNSADYRTCLLADVSFFFGGEFVLPFNVLVQLFISSPFVGKDLMF